MQRQPCQEQMFVVIIYSDLARANKGTKVNRQRSTDQCNSKQRSAMGDRRVVTVRPETIEEK
jgi:hypothetical protein